VNFSNKGKTLESMKTFLTADAKVSGEKLKQAFSIKESFSKEMDGIDRFFLRISYILTIMLILYLVLLQFLTTNMNQKIEETGVIIADTKGKITQVANYKSLVDARNTEYQQNR